MNIQTEHDSKRKAINIMKIVMGKKWGGDRKSKQTIDANDTVQLLQVHSKKLIVGTEKA